MQAGALDSLHLLENIRVINMVELLYDSLERDAWHLSILHVVRRAARSRAVTVMIGVEVAR